VGRKKENKKCKKWIQKAIKRPGRIEKYMMRKYGTEAFTKDGKIKVGYINKELERIKESGGGVHGKEKSLYSALQLAKRLKKMAKKRKKK